MPAPASATRIGVERAVIASASKAEEAHGIAREYAIEIAGVVDPALDGLQRRGIAEAAGHVDEGPVGTPDAPLDAEGVDDGVRERLEVPVSAGLAGNPERRRQLDGGIALAAEPQNRLKARLVEASGDIAHAEVVDQNLDAAPAQNLGDLRPLGIVGEDLGIPAERLQSREETRRLGPRERVGL